MWPGRSVSGPRPVPVAILAAWQRTTVRWRRSSAPRSPARNPLLPRSLREHAVAELLLWLAEEGVGSQPVPPPGFAARLRALLGEDLAAACSAPEAARALAVSEATLRRRLAQEGTVFSDLLVDLRMTRALGLLQTTSHPVGRVALEVGYDCPSHFAARFRTRFGITPSAVRGRVDRIGSRFDRRGLMTEYPGR